MTVVFRPLHPASPDAEADEVFDNGEVIPDALIPIEPLPKGFPTELFAPRLVNGSFAIRIDIDVAAGKLLLSPRPQRGHTAVPVQALSYVVFAQQGLPLSLPVYEPNRGFVDTPGRLYPLLEQKTPGRGMPRHHFRYTCGEYAWPMPSVMDCIRMHAAPHGPRVSSWLTAPLP